MPGELREIRFKFSESSMTLGEALETPTSGRIGSAERFIDFKAPLFDRDENYHVINRVYAFARNFRGHEVNNLVEDHEYVDPLKTPLEDMLDFFAAGDKILAQVEHESSRLNMLNYIKLKRLLALVTSVSEDMERVAEAVVLAVADKVAKSDSILANMVGTLEGCIDQQKDADEGRDSATPAYALALSNPVLGMGLARVIEGGVEQKRRKRVKLTTERVKLTTEIVETVSPQLDDLGLLASVDKWISFSN